MIFELPYFTYRLINLTVKYYGISICQAICPNPVKIQIVEANGGRNAAKNKAVGMESAFCFARQ